MPRIEDYALIGDCETAALVSCIALVDLSRGQPADLKVLGELLAAEHTVQLGEQWSTGTENQGSGLRGVDQLAKVAVPEKARDGCNCAPSRGIDGLASRVSDSTLRA